MAKILIVEDEFDLRETLVETLNDEGHITIEAGNGLEGLECLAAGAPDMIISDITMPEMNGYQFFRSVKENFPEHEFTPFIFLSALSDREDQLKGLRLGVDDYMTKPVDYDLLLTKIELNVRRHIAQAKRQHPAEIPSSDPASSATKSDESPSIAKLRAIIRNNDAKVVVGKIETVGADILEAKFGIDWEETAEEFQALTAATLQNRLGPKDIVHVLPPKDTLICFYGLPEIEAEAKLGELRDAVWDALCNQWNDTKLLPITVQSDVIKLSQERPIEDESIFAEIDERLTEQKAASNSANRTTLLENHRKKSLFALKLLTPACAPSKIKLLNFEKATLLENRKILSERRYDRDFLITLYECLFRRLTEKKGFREAFSKGAMLLPLHFSLVNDEAARNHMTKLCKDLKENLETTVIIELINTPDRFYSHINAIRPLPIGGQVQFVELRRLEQLGSLELGQLNELGVAFFTMRFQHVLQQEPALLQHLIKTFESNGVKFYIKEVPDGKLAEAQQFGAHLYSMH